MVSTSMRTAGALGMELARARPWDRLRQSSEPASEDDETAVYEVEDDEECEEYEEEEGIDEAPPVRADQTAAATKAKRGASNATDSVSTPAVTTKPPSATQRNKPPAPITPGQDAEGELVVRSHGQRPPTHGAPLEPYPKELGDWELPSQDLLDEPEIQLSSRQEAVVRDKARILENTLEDFRIEAKVVEIDTGPVITLYELALAAGIKVSQIVALSNDIARALKAPAVRVVAPIPGKNTVGIEVPNLEKEKVRMRELMSLGGSKALRMHLPLFIGKDASGNPLISDLATMPHLLIAGTTGSGKSVCINSIIMSLLMTQRPDMVKMILIDPKMVELSSFKTVPHLMSPIITEVPRAEMILDWAAQKMDERYELLAEAGVRNIAAYNRLGKDEIMARFLPTTDDERAQIPVQLPYVIIVIDELADLMMQSGKTVELQLSRLAQKSRAVGIHIVVATQRPEAKVVTGLIKSNLPSRIAFRVSSRLDSRIVLDQNGAEVLMGQGDMLFLPPGSAKLMRAQGTFIEDAELKSVIEDLAEKGEPEFHPELMKMRSQEASSNGPKDELFDDAVRIVLESGRGSVSLLQRRLMVGYARASRLIEQMADAGVVGTYKGSQAREVTVTLEEWEKRIEAPTAVEPESLPTDEFPVNDRFADDEPEEEEDFDVASDADEESEEEMAVDDAYAEEIEDSDGEVEDPEEERSDDAEGEYEEDGEEEEENAGEEAKP
jgi:S-DNA-T family DNA segregation ATPase FtsK/SpoIIIE